MYFLKQNDLGYWKIVRHYRGQNRFEHDQFQSFDQAETTLIDFLKSGEKFWWKAKYPGYDPCGNK